MKPFLVAFALFSCAFVSAQNMGLRPVVPLEQNLRWKAELSAVRSGAASTSGMFPLSRWSASEIDTDTTGKVKGLFGPYNTGISLGSLVRVTAQPRMSLSAFNAAGSRSRSGFNALVGAEVSGTVGTRWSFQTSYDVGHAEYPNYMEAIVDSLWVVPGMGRAFDNGKGSRYSQFGFVVGWKASKHFELFAGRGKHFIGDGYRTLFLSDYASNYNYGRLDLDVWKLNYSVLYTQMSHTQDYPNRFYPLQSKYSTMHYLTLDVTRWWTIGAFEAVVWEQEDSLINRGFDIHYLNPVIFFRPVEFGMGSTDNSLIGFSSTVRPWQNIHLYGQVMLDEFIFSEVTAGLSNRVSDTVRNTGSWTNKQALQLGFKWFEPAKWNNAMILAEFNLVRPYTYGHSAPGQSYTHLNQPLGHPLGANFIEWVAMVNWQPKQWIVNLATTYSRKGYSNQDGYLGEDLLVSNIGRAREFDNEMLQGRLIDVANINLTVGRMLIRNWNLRIESGIQYRLERTNAASRNTTVFNIAIKTALWNDERNL